VADFSVAVPSLTRGRLGKWTTRKQHLKHYKDCPAETPPPNVAKPGVWNGRLPRLGGVIQNRSRPNIGHSVSMDGTPNERDRKLGLDALNTVTIGFACLFQETLG
jgi:hypothetical protein